MNDDYEALREQLAAKFANIFMPRLGDGTPYEGLHQFQKEEWRKLADECLRQMEWARGIGYRHADDAREDDSLYLKVNRPPTTLAPQDWKP